MITADRLREVLAYNHATGDFIRLVAACNRVKIGDIAGGLDSEGYRQIMVDGRKYKAHRLAWLWMTGVWPAGQIDHLNLNRSDNRWANIREASRSQNGANTDARVNNTSGFKGVSFYKRYGNWRASISVSSKRVHLGYRDTREDAAELYARAAREYFGKFARSS